MNTTRPTSYLRLGTLLWCGLLVSYAHGIAIVNFETKPDGNAPIDDTPLGTSDAYTLDNGVQMTFGIDHTSDFVADTAAYFEQIGANGDDGFSGFPTNSSEIDTAAPGYEAQLGTFFLRAPNHFLDVDAPLGLRIDFDAPDGYVVTQISGEVWDIDGGTNYEEWIVIAFNSANSIIGLLNSPQGDDDALNQKPWDFELIVREGFDHILIHYIGARRMGIGQGFNNFTASINRIPEPTSATLFALGFLLPAGLGSFQQRRP